MYSSRVYQRSERSGNDYQSGGDRGGNDNNEKSSLRVDCSHIGRIIGQGGRTINELQRQYNVRINIGKEQNDDGTKDVEISGRFSNNVSNATDAINDIISRNQNGGSGSGGSGSGGFSRGGGFGGGNRGGNDGGYSRNNWGGNGNDRRGGGFGGGRRDFDM